MARERNLFDLEDVACTICDKLVRRHPHVFDKENIQQHKNWEQIKQQERKEKSKSESLLSDIPAAMPQLLRAKKIQKRVASVGFDWQQLNPVIDKVQEELNELKEVIDTTNNQEDLEEELGDLLFSVVNLSRHISVNAEDALRKGNKKFIKRFQHIEENLKNDGKNISTCSVEELEGYWQQAKEKLA